MLRRLKVVNFAVAERVELEFSSGFTAMTGETGAGKSILLEALGFLLGSRGSSSWLRAGADRLEVEGVFDTTDFPEELRQRWSIGSDSTVTVRRELDSTGKTRAEIGAKPAPVAALTALGAACADFHAQHENQSLLRPSVQLDLLDRFGGLEDERRAIDEAYSAWSSLKARLEASSMSEEERRRRTELLRFQVAEIDAVNPRLGEEEELEERLPRLKNAERLRSFADTAHGLLYAEENAALGLLQKAGRALGELARIDSSMGRLREELDGARLATESVAHAIGDYRDRVSSDPEALDALLSRQDALGRLKKRHGATIPDVLNERRRLGGELSDLENADHTIDVIRRELDEAQRALAVLCEQIHKSRTQAARRLELGVLKELKPLGLPRARFVCSVEMEEGAWSRCGADSVEFQLAANPGESLRSVKAVASGGELSRVMLALKTAFAKSDRTPLLIFDEVDSGVGGEVARAVGERLASLAKGRQVLCVTHMPQVACYARTHLHVSKEVAAGRTRVRVERLEGSRRLEAVALMLGGRAASSAGLKHAQELLETST